MTALSSEEVTQDTEETVPSSQSADTTTPVPLITQATSSSSVTLLIARSGSVLMYSSPISVWMLMVCSIRRLQLGSSVQSMAVKVNVPSAKLMSALMLIVGRLQLVNTSMPVPSSTSNASAFIALFNTEPSITSGLPSITPSGMVRLMQLDVVGRTPTYGSIDSWPRTSVAENTKHTHTHGYDKNVAVLNTQVQLTTCLVCRANHEIIHNVTFFNQTLKRLRNACLCRCFVWKCII